MKQKGMVRFAAIAFFTLSLAGNFFALGYVVHQSRSGTGTLIEMLETRYPPDVRTAFQAVLRNNRENVRAAINELRTARRNQEELAALKPLDEARLRASMGEVRTRTTAVQSLLQDLLVNAIADAETRQKGRE